MVGPQVTEAHASPTGWHPQPRAGRDTVAQPSIPSDLGRALPSLQGPLLSASLQASNPPQSLLCSVPVRTRTPSSVSARKGPAS